VFGRYPSDAFWTYVKTVKWGLPDQFFTALGGSAWVESKIGANGLEKSQEMTVPRMARGGAVVWLAQGDTHLGLKQDRVVRFTRVGLPVTHPVLVIVGWQTFAERSFWHRLMGVA